MNPIRSAFARLAATAVLALLPLAFAGAQDDTPIASPATQAVAIENPLRTPHDTVDLFLVTLRKAESTRDPNARADLHTLAMDCLDLGTMDMDTRAAKGPDYVVQLYDILSALIDAGYLDPNDTAVLPDEPTVKGDVQSFGKPPFVLVLERLPREVVSEAGTEPTTIHEWRFSANTVREIPRWHENLPSLREAIAARAAHESKPAVQPADLKLLRSPFHTVTYFLDRASEAKEVDTAYYADALRCLDFSEAAAAALKAELKLETAADVADAMRLRGPEYIAAFAEESGIAYVDGLARILGALQQTGQLKLDDLDAELPDDHKPTYAFGLDPLGVTLIRQADGRWLFGAETVRDVPRMLEALADSSAGQPEPIVSAPPAGDTSAALPVAASPAAAASAGVPHVRSAFRSPRATVRTFRRAMREGDLARATQCLDLSELSVTQRELAPIMAGKLWLVMIRTEWIPESQIPDDSDGDSFDLLARTAGRVELDRQWTPPREGAWLFTSRTVAKIETLYDTMERQPIHPSWAEHGVSPSARAISPAALPALFIREYWVPSALRHDFLRIELWQWLGVLLLLVLGPLARVCVSVVAAPIGRRILSTRDVAMLPSTVRRSLMPLAMLAMLGVWWGGLQLLDLPQVMVMWAYWLLRIVMTFFSVLAAYRLIDLVMTYSAARAAGSASRLDDVVVPLMDKTLKVMAVALGLIFLLNVIFGIDAWRLVAGLGVGGLAIAFAAQDTIKNFFGSINVVLDRPFQVGDWVIVGGVEGMVDSVGLRSTRIRTFYKSQVTIPNSEIMNATIDNMQRRPLRRFKAMIGVTYDTKPEALEAFTEGIRELIRQHPVTHKETFYVYVNELGDSSIDILLYCFLEARTWEIELRERQRLIVDMVRLANSLGVEFAFPTRTLHMYSEEANAARMDHIPAKVPAALSLGRESAAGIVDTHLPAAMKAKP